MKKQILCINPGTAYLPEIEAYKKYFSNYNISFIDSYKDMNNIYNEKDYDLLWYMMGTDFKKIDKPKVHDYASLSTGRNTFIKDKIKRYFNQKPNLRLFLNQTIMNTYYFKDNIPFLIRDMGIDDIFFNKLNIKKKYDFVYLGAITHERKIPILFDKFKNELTKSSLLVIGDVPADIYEMYKEVSNIVFRGKVSYSKVPELVSQAEYGINMIPNIHPFNVQTSTKLLEYSALGLKIVTTNYEWVNSFEREYEGSFFKLDDALNNFNLNNLKKFNFKKVNVESLKWNTLFNNINLIGNIKKLYANENEYKTKL